MTSVAQIAKKKIEAGASVLFAHSLYKRPTLANCQKLAWQLGVPVVIKSSLSAKQHIERSIRACFVSNGVKPVSAAVRYYAWQVKYMATYVTPHGALLCFVCDEHAEDILFSAYFDRAAHDDALHNEAGVLARLRELDDLDAE